MSSALDDIQKLLDAMKGRGAEMRAFEGLLTEISGSLADIVVHLERSQPSANSSAGIKELSAALKEGLQTLKIQAPAVHVQAPKGAEWKSLQVKVGKNAFDGSKEYTITKL